MNKHVLIADSDMRVSRVLSRIINRMGFECFSVHHHDAFKVSCSETSPDIIILSLEMALGEQDNLLDYLTEQYPLATAIFLLNLDDDDFSFSKIIARTSGLKIGGFLRKPIDINTVRLTLEKLAENSPIAVKKSQPLYNEFKEYYC